MWFSWQEMVEDRDRGNLRTAGSTHRRRSTERAANRWGSLARQASTLLMVGLAALIGAAPTAAHNNALAFDGVDDVVLVRGLEAPSNTGAVTVEFWNFVRAADQRRLSYAFAFATDKQQARTSAHAPWGDGKLYWDCGNLLQDGRLSTDYRPYLDRWTHIALVSEGRGGGFMGIYLNGKLVASKQRSDGPAQKLVDLLIGSSSDSKYHRGQIDEFRVWNRVRTAAEIRRDMRSPLLGDEPGLVAYYTFDYGRPNLRTVPNRVETGPAGRLRGFALKGEDSNYVASGALLSNSQGLTPGATSRSSLDEFYKRYAGRITFTDQYRQAVSTMLLAQDDVAASRYRQAKEKIDRLWATYPKGSQSWASGDGAGSCRPGEACTGAPVAYASLLMLEDIANHGLATGPPPIARNLRLTVVLAGCSTARKPANPAQLSRGTGTPVEARILPDLTADDNRILRQSTALFRDYAHAMSGGRIHLDVAVAPLPDVCLQVVPSIQPDDPQTVFMQPDISGIWEALPRQTIDSTDWWWVLYPSQVLEDVRAFKKHVFISGGMYTDATPNKGPVFVVDDRWLTRNPPHLGTGPYTDVERRTWLPQWLQHEFFHYLFAHYPGFGLEAEGHQWQDTSKDWPADFSGNEQKIEADYYAESLHKRLQTPAALPPLAAGLRFTPPSPADWASLAVTPAQLAGSYETDDSHLDNYLKGRILFNAGRLDWRNDADVSWSLTPELANGKLAHGRLATGEGNPYRADSPEFLVVVDLDAAGDPAQRVLGFRFGGNFYHRR